MSSTPPSRKVDKKSLSTKHKNNVPGLAPRDNSPIIYAYRQHNSTDKQHNGVTAALLFRAPEHNTPSRKFCTRGKTEKQPPKSGPSALLSACWSYLHPIVPLISNHNKQIKSNQWQVLSKPEQNAKQTAFYSVQTKLYYLIAIYTENKEKPRKYPLPY